MKQTTEYDWPRPTIGIPITRTRADIRLNSDQLESKRARVHRKLIVSAPFANYTSHHHMYDEFDATRLTTETSELTRLKKPSN
jgi:hypothetical protein